MNYKNNLWFPPANILYHGQKELSDSKQLSANDKKPIMEAMAVAVMLVGVNKGTGEEYKLQLVDPSEQTPDIRTMRLIHKPGQPNELNIQDVELVTLGPNSSEEVDDFLLRTKLSPKKSYPPTTVILCQINKTMKQTRSWRDVHNSLKASASKNDVYVLARINPIEQEYLIGKVHPKLESFLTYDVKTELFSRPKQRPLKLSRNSKDELVHTDEISLPF